MVPARALGASFEPFASAVPAVKRVWPLGSVDLGRADRGLEHSTGRERSGERFSNIAFETDLPRRNLAERDDRRLVALGLDKRRGAGRELPGAARGQDAEGKAIVDELGTVLDGDASHANLGADGWGETVLRFRSVLKGSRCRRVTAAHTGRTRVAGQQQLGVPAANRGAIPEALALDCAEGRNLSGCTDGCAGTGRRPDGWPC